MLVFSTEHAGENGYSGDVQSHHKGSSWREAEHDRRRRESFTDFRALPESDCKLREQLSSSTPAKDSAMRAHPAMRAMASANDRHHSIGRQDFN
ncbi:hypothetical protein MRX96_007145 [Rhipicephalus microplus]